MGKILISILNWNRCDDLRRLIKSVLKDVSTQSQNTYKIVVIDNASTDASIPMMESEYNEIDVIINSENLGGSGGFNTALRYGIKENFDFVWMLDNDVEVIPGALQGLLDTMALDPKIALVGSKILHRDDPKVVVELGANINPLSTFPSPLYQNMLDTNLKARVLDVDYVAICSALIRMSVISTCGILDENFFLMWDDMEWGLRLRRYGYRVVAANKSAVIHPGFTERTVSTMFTYYAWRNHLYFISVTYKGLKRIFYAFYILWLMSAHRILASWSEDALPFATAIEYAFSDFCDGKFGKSKHDLTPPSKMATKEIQWGSLLQPSQNIVISADKPVNKIKTTINDLKRIAPDARIILLVSHLRRHLFSWYNENDIWIYKGFMSRISIAFKIKRENIHRAITFNETLPRLLLSIAEEIWVVSDAGSLQKKIKPDFKICSQLIINRLVAKSLGALIASCNMCYVLFKTKNFKTINHSCRHLYICQ